MTKCKPAQVLLWGQRDGLSHLWQTLPNLRPTRPRTAAQDRPQYQLRLTRHCKPVAPLASDGIVSRRRLPIEWDYTDKSLLHVVPLFCYQQRET